VVLREVCRPYRGFTTVWTTIPGLYSPGKGYADPSGRRHRARFKDVKDFGPSTVFNVDREG
jgi:hypothetical protein